MISHHQSPGASPSRSSSSSSASSSVSETSLAGNLLNIRNSRSCSYYPNHHHQRLSHEHHDHHSAPSLLHHAPHPPHPLLLQPPQDQGIRALQQFYHQHPSNSHYFTNRQPVISGWCVFPFSSGLLLSLSFESSYSSFGALPIHSIDKIKRREGRGCCKEYEKINNNMS